MWQNQASTRCCQLPVHPAFHLVHTLSRLNVCMTVALDCTWVTPKVTLPLTSWRATSACGASTCCTPWAGTHSVCLRSSTQSRWASGGLNAHLTEDVRIASDFGGRPHKQARMQHQRRDLRRQCCIPHGCMLRPSDGYSRSAVLHAWQRGMSLPPNYSSHG